MQCKKEKKRKFKLIFSLTATLTSVVYTIDVLLENPHPTHFYHHPRKASMDVSATRASYTKEDNRTLIKFHVLLNKTPVETHAALKEALQEYAPSYETVRTWTNTVKGGQEGVKDASRSGRTLSATTPEKLFIVWRRF